MTNTLTEVLRMIIEAETKNNVTLHDRMARQALEKAGKTIAKKDFCLELRAIVVL